MNINIERIFLVLIFIITFAAFLYFAYMGKKWEAGLILPFLLVTFMSALPSTISELHWPGGKLKRVIKEAKSTIDELKELAKVLSKSSLSNTARSGWLGGLTDEQRNIILKETSSVLWNIGLSSNEISDVVKDYHDCVISSYKTYLTGGSMLPDCENNDYKKEWDEIRKVPVGEHVPRKTIEDFLIKYDLMQDSHQKRLDDYEYYLNNKEFADFEDYKKRNEWFSGRLKQVKNA